MTRTIAIIAPGAMGSAVARRLADHGARVLTSLAGRSPATRGRAEASGMVDATDDQIAAAEVILSILPPGEAVALAERLAPALARAAHRPIYVDCNAIDVRTTLRVAAILDAGPARFVDGAIIGAPPAPGKAGPTIFLAGAPAADLDWLQEFGLKLRRIDGPMGAASALKMSYAGITKGLTAIAAAMVLAAGRAGSIAAAPGAGRKPAATPEAVHHRPAGHVPQGAPLGRRNAGDRGFRGGGQRGRPGLRGPRRLLRSARGRLPGRASGDRLIEAFLDLPDPADD